MTTLPVMRSDRTRTFSCLELGAAKQTLITLFKMPKIKSKLRPEGQIVKERRKVCSKKKEWRVQFQRERVCAQEMGEQVGGSDGFESREASQDKITEGLDFRGRAKGRQETFSREE